MTVLQRVILPALLLVGGIPGLAQTTTSNAVPASTHADVDVRDPVWYPGDTERLKPLVHKLAANIWLDQKDIWTSPFHMKKSDAKWWLGFGAVTGALIATDHESSKLFENSQGQDCVGQSRVESRRVLHADSAGCRILWLRRTSRRSESAGSGGARHGDADRQPDRRGITEDGDAPQSPRFHARMPAISSREAPRSLPVTPSSPGLSRRCSPTSMAAKAKWSRLSPIALRPSSVRPVSPHRNTTRPISCWAQAWAGSSAGTSTRPTWITRFTTRRCCTRRLCR